MIICLGRYLIKTITFLGGALFVDFMDVAPAYATCLSCGHMNGIWSFDGSFKCEKCGALCQVPLEHDCPYCNKKTTTDRYGACQVCGQLKFEADDTWEEAMQYDKRVSELAKIVKINPKSFENLITNALQKHAFIEAISLIHNTIEAYLKGKIEAFFGEDNCRYELLKGYVKLNRLYNYNGFCYILGLLSKDVYEGIKKFNEERNKVVHDLLKEEITMESLRMMARKGRELQMRTSPLNHSEADIQRVMQIFDKITV